MKIRSDLLSDGPNWSEWLASTAANGGTADGDAARAAGVAACAECIAAGLQHAAAGSITAAASNATTVLSQFALGVTTAQIALENDLSIPQTAAVAHASLKHLAKVLQSSTSDIVFATAVDFDTTLALLELQGATWQDTGIGRTGCSGAGTKNISVAGGQAIHHDRRHSNVSFAEKQQSKIDSDFRWSGQPSGKELLSLVVAV